jgi:pimeloyl-ACP methyl ester carboxylesterase
MSAVSIDNDLVHYEVLGRGNKPVILVHGWLGSWRYWIPTMQQLSTKFRTYALDLWGFGDSSQFSPTDPRYRLEEQTQLLGTFMDRLGITRAALIGHGLGAVVVLRYSAQHPERFPRVVAISPPVHGGWLSERLVGSARNGELVSLVPRNLSDDSLQTEVQKADGNAVLASALLIRGEDPGNGTGVEPVVPVDLGRSLKSVLDANEETQKKNMALVLHGTQDTLVKPPEGRSVTDILGDYGLSEHPRLLSIVLDEISHFPMLEDASNFNRLLYGFLEVTSSDELPALRPKEQWRRRYR